VAFSSVSFSAISAISSKEGKGSCLLGFHSLSSDVETVLGELHVLQCLTCYFQMTRQNTYWSTVRVLRNLHGTKPNTYNSGPEDGCTPACKLRN
jgi:hypothetical protein